MRSFRSLCASELAHVNFEAFVLRLVVVRKISRRRIATEGTAAIGTIYTDIRRHTWDPTGLEEAAWVISALMPLVLHLELLGFGLQRGSRTRLAWDA